MINVGEQVCKNVWVGSWELLNNEVDEPTQAMVERQVCKFNDHDIWLPIRNQINVNYIKQNLHLENKNGM